MSTKEPQLDWREGRRQRAWELKEHGWKQQDIAAALGVTPGAVSQWLSRARQGGVEALRRVAAPSGGRSDAAVERGATRPDSGAHCSWAGGVRLSRAGLDVQAGR